MNDHEKVTHVGHITQTTPPSSPLDTLKALVLRNLDHLDYVSDRLSDADCGVPDDVIEFIDFIRQAQYKALAEHVHVAKHEVLDELRYLHPDAYRYDDGTPVVEQFKAKYGQSTYFTRYDGPRDEAIKRHEEWVAQYQRSIETESKFGEIVEGVDWGRDGSNTDL